VLIIPDPIIIVLFLSLLGNGLPNLLGNTSPVTDPLKIHPAPARLTRTKLPNDETNFMNVFAMPARLDTDRFQYGILLLVCDEAISGHEISVQGVEFLDAQLLR
jgi:hypothetical protein